MCPEVVCALKMTLAHPGEFTHAEVPGPLNLKVTRAAEILLVRRGTPRG